MLLYKAEIRSKDSGLSIDFFLLLYYIIICINNIGFLAEYKLSPGHLHFTEKKYFVRTMIVGKESAGKTCLMRRLLREDITDVTSTDGLDVRWCKVDIRDGTWIIDKGI